MCHSSSNLLAVAQGQLGSDDAMVVITREQSRKQLKEDIVRREQELLSGMEPKQIAGITHEVARTPKWSVEYHTGSATKEMGNFQDHSTKSNALEDTLLRNFSNGNKQRLDRRLILKRVRLQKVETPIISRGMDYSTGDWYLPEERSMNLNSLTCPKHANEQSSSWAMKSHLGADKTREYILRLFYWPIIFKDIEEFCRCCEICQKTSSQKFHPASLMSLPVNTEPFKKIAMDIVGGGVVMCTS